MLNLERLLPFTATGPQRQRPPLTRNHDSDNRWSDQQVSRGRPKFPSDI